MRPYDALTDIEKTTISTYLSIYGGVECGPLDTVLYEWNKNKTTLFKALGRKLQVSRIIDIPKDRTAVLQVLTDIYRTFLITNENDYQIFSNNPDFYRENIGNDFIFDVTKFWVEKNYCLSDISILTKLFMHRNLVNGYICTCISTEPYHFRDFKCTVKNGMKTIRTIQKVLKATGYDRMDLFEKWRNQVSLVQTSDTIKAKLVLSINPIDFMSMSDNSCNWQSCMGWHNSGCYNAGTLEMMNSNVTAVAYLESNSEFVMSLDETGEVYPIPNKSWRSLVFIHKDIILVGKPYPYVRDSISKEVLSFAEDLVQQNLNWQYQFRQQRYRDMDNLNGNYYVRDWFNVNYDIKRSHHSIFVYTNGMYNDIIESHQDYWCSRNYVSKSKKICLSGPSTCICCGRRLFERDRDDILSYDDLGHDKICWECRSKRSCTTCGQIHYRPKYFTKFGQFCSDNCARDTIVLPELNRSCRKEDLQFGAHGAYVLFFDLTKFYKEDIYKIHHDFQYAKDDENYIIQLRQELDTCNTDVKIYKVPQHFTGWCGVDLTRYICDDWTINGKSGRSIYMYDRSRRRIPVKEQNCKALRYWIPLLEYLQKEGE